MNYADCDFKGWATKTNCRCSDGLTIRQDAFKDCDGKKVPIVYNHDHSNIDNVIGHAFLQNRPEGVYSYGYFNDTKNGKIAKILVQSGDLDAMSICANEIKKIGSDVVHGTIREVSLVLAGANPEAFIEEVINHSADSEDQEIIAYFNDPLEISHADEMKEEPKGSSSNTKEPKESDKEAPKEPESEETVGDVFNTMSEKQKNVVYALIGQILDDTEAKTEETKQSTNTEGEDTVKYNVFDKSTGKEETTLVHSEDLTATLKDAKRLGSLKESAIQHGIENLEVMFPDHKSVTASPTQITRDMEWVNVVMSGVHHTAFARIKSIFADLTEDDARAKGYLKGKYKKEEVFGLLKRTTDPTTVYKKQKMDRDDLIDADFDVVAMLRSEMRMMLNEELARAFLFGDGRLASSDDKINELCIRPVWTDEDLFTIKYPFTVTQQTDDAKAKAFITAAIKARKNYKGSGSPVLFTTEDNLTNMLLLTDSTGRDIYTDEAQLARKLRVSRIVTVPVMEGLKRSADSKNYELYGLILNMRDYNVGADKGGAVTMFDDFDIDYNAQKYLIETRCSGALTVPYSAIAVELQTNGD